MFNVRRIHNFNAWSSCRALCSSNWLMILTCGSPHTVVVFDCGFPMIDPVTSRTYSHFRRGQSSHQRRCPLEKARDPATWHGQPCNKFLITVITFLVTLLGSVIFQSKLLVDVFGPKTRINSFIRAGQARFYRASQTAKKHIKHILPRTYGRFLEWLIA